jgi:hypothetical protein
MTSILSPLFALLLVSPAWTAAAAAEETGAPGRSSWEADFEAVCARTPEVMALPREELLRLAAECDRLQPQIEALAETPRKVYRKRLEMTRNLLLFALEAKEQPAAQ